MVPIAQKLSGTRGRDAQSRLKVSRWSRQPMSWVWADANLECWDRACLFMTKTDFRCPLLSDWDRLALQPAMQRQEAKRTSLLTG